MYIAGEEEYRVGPLSIECPHCGSLPGFSCRKPSGQKYVGHLERIWKAKAQRERDRRTD